MILYEMLTGSQLFKGETVSDTMASVLTQEPDLNKVSPKVRPLLKRCLAKDPKLRLRDIGDTMSLLEFTPEIEYTDQPKKSNRLAWGLVILAALIAVISIIFVFLEKPKESAELRYLIDYPDNVTPGPVGNFAISPDGLQLAFIGIDSNKTMLWLQRLDSFEARPLPGTEIPSTSGYIFWSPDSQFIAFEAGEQLKKFDVSNGSVRKICDLSGIIIGGSWNRDDVIIFWDTVQNSLMLVPAAGGKPSSVMEPDPDKGEMYFYLPVFLPDGNHFLYHCGSNDYDKQGIYIGDLGDKSGEQIRKRIINTGYNSLYVSSKNNNSDYLLTIEDHDIVAKRFNPKSLELDGNFYLLAQGVGNYGEYGFFSASNNDVLVFREALQEQFQWIGKDGTLLEIVGAPGDYYTFDLSRDASQLIFSKSESGNKQNLWSYDLLRKGSPKPLTFENAGHVDPRLSRNGDFVIFGNTQDTPRNPFRLNLSSSSNPERVFEFNGSMFSLDDISPDNEYLLYHDAQVPELWVRSISGDEERQPVAKYPTGTIDQARFSPDGHWIAFNSSESGHYEIKVVPFPATGYECQISAGVQPMWKGDGSELYFISPDGTLMSVDVSLGKTFEFGTIRPLFPSGLSVDPSKEEYAPDPSGERFLVLKSVEENKDAQFKVIHNWSSLLEQ